jgi:DNA-binding transcriptional regulator YhcF (GntR family)
MGMEPDDAKNRTKQQGKDPSGKKDKKSKYYEDPNFITRATLSEIQKQKAIKVVEDMLAKKKDSGSADVGKKETESLSPVLKKNLQSLIKQAEKHGFSKKDLIKIIQGE